MPEVILVKDSDKKHSVLFKRQGPDNPPIAVIDSLYLKRPFSDKAKKIRVTVEVLE